MDGSDFGQLTWSTALPDWKERIRSRKSLVPDLPLNQAVADKALRVFKRLRVPDIEGNPTYGEVCDQWTFDIVRAIFGAYDPETKKRALREFFLLIPKGNAKSAIAAAIMVTAMILNTRPRAEGLMIAPRIKVADIAFQQAAGIIQLDPDLRVLFHPQEHLRKITHLNTMAFLQIKAADKEVVTGSKATFILIDETHEFAGNAKADAIFLELRGSLGKRPDGFLMQITTQSKTPPSGVFKAELEVARAVRDGKIAKPLLPVLYELPVEDTVDNGWMRPELWGLVNPNLGRSVNAEFLADQVATARSKGAEALALVASQHFNVEVGLGLHADRWPGALFWEGARRALSLDDILAQCEVCTVGYDGGGLDDLAALAVIGRHRDTKVWMVWVKAWAQPEVFERRKEIAGRLRDFVADGDLVVCESVDQNFREAADICERLSEAGLLPDKAGIGLDAYGISALLDELEVRGLGGDLLTAVGQGYKLQSSILGLPLKLKGGSLVHCGQEILNWAVSNAKTELRGSNYLVTKAAAGSAKIDPLMALFNAAMLMQNHPQPSSGAALEIPDDYTVG